MLILTKLVPILAIITAAANIIEPLPHWAVSIVCGALVGVTLDWLYK